ncbi:MAG: hypothetical protein JXB03_08395 [Spirochaetales bacterium]|nr:hypothetical protein [Spirochaetales bacterium]
MAKMVASVFIELVRSWEFLLAAVFLTLAIPLIFYVASLKPLNLDASITAKVRKAKERIKHKDTSAENDPEDDDTTKD